MDMDDTNAFNMLSMNRRVATQFINHLILFSAVSTASAQETAIPSPAVPTPAANLAIPNSQFKLPPEEARESMQWAIYLIQQNLPAKYEKSKNWGETKRVYAGIDIDNDGLKLKTHRRWREVRHGKWLKYSIDLKDPTLPKNLNIEVVRAEMQDNGRLRLELTIHSHVDIDARQERWNLGMQMYSLSMRGHAKLRMNLVADIGFHFDYTRVPPDVRIDPLVESANIELVDLEVDKISKLGSDIAGEIGDVVERILKDDYLPKQNAKLADKLNAQINRRRDKLRISASDWLTSRIGTR
jgi:hypothetical protein